jgi:hypothetical protein
MTTPIYLTGFEHGVISTNGGGVADLLTGTAGTEVACATSPVRSGTYSLKIAPTLTTGGRWSKNVAGTPTVLVQRFYLYITTAPSTADWIGTVVGTTAAYCYLYLNPTSGKFELYCSGTPVLVAQGPTYTTGQWYLVDWKVDLSANPWTTYCKIDGGTEFGGTYAAAADTVARMSFGHSATTGPAYEVYFDDLILSSTAGDYPIGAGAVATLSPYQDGTHNNAANVLEDALGNDIDGTTYKACEQLDELPMSDTSTRVQCNTAGSANYVEVLFADTTETDIQGAVALLAYMSASSTANNGACIIIHEDATETTLWGNPTTRADYSESSMFYKSALLPTPAGGWDTAAVNALKTRLGYSSDATPDPYWENMLIEFAYIPGAAPAAAPSELMLMGVG